jgi:predicted ATPase
MLRAIQSDNFPPFGKFGLTLPPVENKPDDLAEVHLFTGGNGTGKTRLLSVLAAMLENPEPLAKRVKGITDPISIRITG